MNTLGSRKDRYDLDDNASNPIIPAVIREKSSEIPLGKAIMISLVAHPIVLAFLWLLIYGILFLLTLLGITLPIFQKPEPKMRDIEFVIVNKPEQTPINRNTKYRSDRNSRAGGKHDPTRQVSEPEPVAAKSSPQRASAPAPRHQAPVKQMQPQHQEAQPAPVPPRPAPMASVPRPHVSRPSAFSIPVPKMKGPRSSSSTGGPVTSAPMGSGSPSSSPSPVMSSRGGYGSGGSGRYNSPYSTGGGNAGNPGPGNPNGSPGIDAIKEPDFGPYMKELQRRIKSNWEPPRGNESRRVVLLFKVARDGSLKSVKVYKSSGIPSADSAAIGAVNLSAPFRPLPPEFRGSDIDIQFTFDYNVFGVGRYY